MSLIYAYLVKSGLREKSHATESNQYRFASKEIPQNHGFRKFFDTNLMRDRIMPVYKEMLMGHTMGLDDVYCKPEQSEIMFEYLKAVDNLTINEKKQT